MKVQISFLAALAVAVIGSTANGQQHTQPVAAQNWAVPIVQASTTQEPALRVPSNAAPAPVASGAYSQVVNGNGRGTYDCAPIRYVSLFAGGVSFDDFNLDLGQTDATGAPVGVGANFKPNDGWTIGGAIGRSFGRRFRGEVEYSYRNASISSADLTVNGVVTPDANMGGQVNVYRSMTNLLWDFNPNGRFNAYVGGGLGLGLFDLDAVDSTTPITTRMKSSSFAWQGIIGLSGRINERAELFMDYRYAGTDRLEITTVSPVGGANANVDFNASDVIFGIRLRR